MATLLGLPNETLLQIIEHNLAPHDLPSFALSCKHMLALSERCLIQYVERKKKYSVIKFHGCSRHDNETSLATFLHEMVDDHRVASYPRSFVMEYGDCTPECEYAFECGGGFEESGFHNDANDIDHFGVGGIKMLDSIINDFEDITTQEQDGNDDQRLEVRQSKLYPSSEWDTVIALLLCTLPNIETLTLQTEPTIARAFHYILSDVVEKNSRRGHASPTVLTKLKTVVLDASHPDDFCGIFGCLGLLPSVERLCGNFIRSPCLGNSTLTRRGYQYCWPARDNLALTDIDFQDSELGFEFFSQLLRGVTRLRRFTYEVGFGFDSTGTDPYRLIDLLRHSRETLEYLELKGFASEQAPPPDDAGHGSLRNFEALKDIRIHSGLWTVPEIQDESTHSKKKNKDCCPTDGRVIYPLVAMLPSRVQTVQLEGPIHMRDVNRFLKDLTCSKGRYMRNNRSPKAERLRSLNSIVFRDVERPSGSLEVDAKEWIEECAEVGITLTFEWA